ncbi:hypothetical protein SDC9_209371 [bioreactor metagenome]|uniref:Uncharacterized protein n=1 Tax=bioreactor metagenome TaxID=1076179 RepID=A0A645JPZ9_9ZZZZ
MIVVHLLVKWTLRRLLVVLAMESEQVLIQPQVMAQGKAIQVVKRPLPVKWTLKKLLVVLAMVLIQEIHQLNRVQVQPVC